MTMKNAMLVPTDSISGLSTVSTWFSIRLVWNGAWRGVESWQQRAVTERRLL